MDKPLALRIARQLVNSDIPLTDRAEIIRNVRGSEQAPMIEALTYALASLPQKDPTRLSLTVELHPSDSRLYPDR